MYKFIKITLTALIFNLINLVIMLSKNVLIT